MSANARPMLHCILRDQSCSNPHPEGHPEGLRGIAVPGLMALVADVDPQLIRTADHDRLRGYADLIGRIHRDRSLIPMRFGCVLTSDDAVRKLLNKHRKHLEAMLDQLDDCVEFGVRLVLPDLPAPAATAPPAPSPAPADPGAGPGRSHLAQVRQRLHDETQAATRAAEVRLAVERLAAGRYRDAHQEFGQIGGRFLLSLYFLVPRCDADAFVTALRQDPAAVPATGLITGPWPPFNFVGAIDDELGSLV